MEILSLPFIFFPDPSIKLGSTLNAEMFSAITIFFKKQVRSLGFATFQAKIDNNNLISGHETENNFFLKWQLKMDGVTARYFYGK
jgi:hypothetical protein